MPITSSTADPRRLGLPSPDRDDDLVRVGHDRVAQEDLEPDDRADPRFEGGRAEADRAVQAVVIGDRQRAHPQPRRPFDQLVRARRPVEEREVRVAVQLGEDHTSNDRTDVLSTPGPNPGEG